MNAPQLTWASVPHHGGKVEHLSRTGGGLLARINEDGDDIALWVLTEGCYRNSWADEVVHVQGLRFDTLDGAKAHAAKVFAAEGGQ